MLKVDTVAAPAWPHMLFTLPSSCVTEVSCKLREINRNVMNQKNSSGLFLLLHFHDTHQWSSVFIFISCLCAGPLTSRLKYLVADTYWFGGLNESESPDIFRENVWMLLTNSSVNQQIFPFLMSLHVSMQLLNIQTCVWGLEHPVLR